MRARYHLTPTDGFDEARAHRLGAEAEHHEPLVQSLAESPADAMPFAPGESILDLPEPPVLVLQVRPERTDRGAFGLDRDAPDGDGVDVMLKNATDERSVASVGSGSLGIDAAWRVGLLGEPSRDALEVADGDVDVDLEPRETALIRLSCST